MCWRNSQTSEQAAKATHKWIVIAAWLRGTCTCSATSSASATRLGSAYNHRMSSSPAVQFSWFSYAWRYNWHPMHKRNAYLTAIHQSHICLWDFRSTLSHSRFGPAPQTAIAYHVMHTTRFYFSIWFHFNFIYIYFISILSFVCKSLACWRVFSSIYFFPVCLRVFSHWIAVYIWPAKTVGLSVVRDESGTRAACESFSGGPFSLLLLLLLLLRSCTAHSVLECAIVRDDWRPPEKTEHQQTNTHIQPFIRWMNSYLIRTNISRLLCYASVEGTYIFIWLIIISLLLSVYLCVC